MRCFVFELVDQAILSLEMFSARFAKDSFFPGIDTAYHSFAVSVSQTNGHLESLSN